MKHSYIYLIFAAALALMEGCNPSLLEIDQKGVVSEESYYSTDDDALSASVVIYSTWNSLVSDWFNLKVALSDEVYTAGASRGDSPFLDDLNEFNYASNNEYLVNTYAGMYKLIFYANTLIEKFPVGESPAKDRCVGEALAARAWAHMELASLWGNPPLIDHVLSGSSDYQQGNSDPEELWAFIIRGFGDAATLLPSRVNNPDKVRIVKEAALAFKGKAQVLSGDMAGAKETLRQVIDSGAFSLVEADALENYFTHEGNFSEENVFESNVVFSQNTMWNHISGICAMLCWRGDKLQGVPSYLFSNGFGFCNPREEFIRDIRAHEEGSNRYKAWFRSWDDLKFMGINRLLAPIYGNCGYFQYKYHFGPEEIPSQGFGLVSIVNWRWMRYAEVLLLYAEACAVTGDDDGSGKKALNDIQSRAGVAPTGLTLENVKTEKRFELFMEGCRFVDLVRWGDAEAALQEQGSFIPQFKGEDGTGGYVVDKTSYINTVFGFKKGKHERLPYPEAETIANQQIKQNPNW